MAIKFVTKSSAVLLTLLVGLSGLLPVRLASAEPVNLVTNPSVELANADGTQPSNWAKNKWGKNSATFTYKSEDAYAGSRSLFVNMTQRTSGDAKWYFSHISVKPSQKYTFSDYYKSSTATEVVIEYINQSNKHAYKWLNTSTASTGWNQNKLTFTTPANVKSLTVYHLINKLGWLQTDEFSLVEGDGTTPPPVPTPPPPTPPPVNASLISNPSFETADGGNPANWQAISWGTNSASFSYLNSGHSGSHSVKAEITNYTNGAANWYYSNIPITPGKTYKYENWYQSNVDTEVDAEVVMSDGTTQYFWVTSVGASTGWNKISAAFTAPAGAKGLTIYHLLAKNGYLITDDYSLSEYQPAKFNRALLSLTFDDGWRSIYTNGLPLLNKYGFVSTQYLLTGTITYPDYMTIEMMNEFKNQGSEIGAHTIDHLDLTTLNNAQLHYQLGQCQADLQQWSGASVQNFASPYGAYNSDVQTAIKQYYRSHRSVEPGYNTKDNFDIYKIKVQNMLNTTTLAEVQSWVNQAQADSAWLVLVYHEVGTNNEDPTYSVTPANLDAQLNLFKQSGIAVVTLNDALNEIASQL